MLVHVHDINISFRADNSLSAAIVVDHDARRTGCGEGGGAGGRTKIRVAESHGSILDGSQSVELSFLCLSFNGLLANRGDTMDVLACFIPI